MRNELHSYFTSSTVCLLLVIELVMPVRSYGEPVQVRIDPPSVTLIAGTTPQKVQFKATVENTGDTSVSWSVAELDGNAIDAGTIDAAGVYTSPTGAAKELIVLVKAVSDADRSVEARARVTITRDVHLRVTPESEVTEVGIPFEATLEVVDSNAFPVPDFVGDLSLAGVSVPVKFQLEDRGVKILTFVCTNPVYGNCSPFGTGFQVLNIAGVVVSTPHDISVSFFGGARPAESEVSVQDAFGFPVPFQPVRVELIANGSLIHRTVVSTGDQGDAAKVNLGEYGYLDEILSGGGDVTLSYKATVVGFEQITKEYQFAFKDTGPGDLEIKATTPLYSTVPGRSNQPLSNLSVKGSMSWPHLSCTPPTAHLTLDLVGGDNITFSGKPEVGDLGSSATLHLHDGTQRKVNLIVHSVTAVGQTINITLRLTAVPTTSPLCVSVSDFSVNLEISDLRVDVPAGLASDSLYMNHYLWVLDEPVGFVETTEIGPMGVRADRFVGTSVTPLRDITPGNLSPGARTDVVLQARVHTMHTPTPGGVLGTGTLESFSASGELIDRIDDVVLRGPVGAPFAFGSDPILLCRRQCGLIQRTSRPGLGPCSLVQATTLVPVDDASTPAHEGLSQVWFTLCDEQGEPVVGAQVDMQVRVFKRGADGKLIKDGQGHHLLEPDSTTTITAPPPDTDELGRTEAEITSTHPGTKVIVATVNGVEHRVKVLFLPRMHIITAEPGGSIRFAAPPGFGLVQSHWTTEVLGAELEVAAPGESSWRPAQFSLVDLNLLNVMGVPSATPDFRVKLSHPELFKDALSQPQSARLFLQEHGTGKESTILGKRVEGEGIVFTPDAVTLSKLGPLGPKRLTALVHSDNFGPVEATVNLLLYVNEDSPGTPVAEDIIPNPSVEVVTTNIKRLVGSGLDVRGVIEQLLGQPFPDFDPNESGPLKFIKETILLTFRTATTDAERSDVLYRHDLRPVGIIPKMDIAVVQMPVGGSPEDLIKLVIKLARAPEIHGASADFLGELDDVSTERLPKRLRERYILGVGKFGGFLAGEYMPDFLERTFAGHRLVDKLFQNMRAAGLLPAPLPQVTVAIIDSGIGDGTRAFFTDIASGQIRNPSSFGIAGSRGGKLQTIADSSLADKFDNPATPRVDGHGTAIAHLIAGGGLRILGTGKDVFIRPIKTSNPVSFVFVAGGVVARDPSVDVLNISSDWSFNFRQPGTSIIRKEFVEGLQVDRAVLGAAKRNKIVVLSAGNSQRTPSLDVLHAVPPPRLLPRNTGNPEDLVLLVSAATRFLASPANVLVERKATFSNFGKNISVAAHGDQIRSIRPDDTLFSFSGTSFAAPRVSGLAGEMLYLDRLLGGVPTTPAAKRAQLVRIVETIEATADDLGIAGDDDEFGHGRINTWKALLAVVNGGIASHGGTADMTRRLQFPSLVILPAVNKGRWYGFEIATAPTIEATAWINDPVTAVARPVSDVTNPYSLGPPAGPGPPPVPAPIPLGNAPAYQHFPAGPSITFSVTADELLPGVQNLHQLEVRTPAGAVIFSVDINLPLWTSPPLRKLVPCKIDGNNGRVSVEFDDFVFRIGDELFLDAG